MKRPLASTRAADKARRSANEYAGHTVHANGASVAAAEAAQFDQYIRSRTPARLVGAPPVALAPFALGQIVRTLRYDALLQVERKHAYGFGLGRARERRTLADIVERVRGDDSYYLTTQYEDGEGEGGESEEESEVAFGDSDSEDDEGAIAVGIAAESDTAAAAAAAADAAAAAAADAGAAAENGDDSDGSDFDAGDFVDDYVDSDDDDDAAYRVRTLLQPPLTNLAETPFPLTPPPFANLIPQQINLWLGLSRTAETKPDLLHPTAQSLGRYVPKGNSLGLHHDHADNLYVLVAGRKRFTLYSPADADTLYTVGNINRVYPNGLVDYAVDEKAPHWRPMRADGAIVAEHARWLLEQKDFSQHSKRQLEQRIENEPTFKGTPEKDLDPPSFSTVPPVLAHLDEVASDAEREALRRFADDSFPGFLQLRKYEVWLGAGDMLYIPTGWFHEVTSFADESPAHIALNWWFVPPVYTGKEPYPDGYWAHDYALTLDAVERVRKATGA